MKWMDIVNGLAGVWLVISAFLRFTDASVNFWNYLIVGSIVTVLGFWAAFGTSNNG